MYHLPQEDYNDHTNQNFYQINSPDFEVGNGKFTFTQEASLIFKSVMPTFVGISAKITNQKKIRGIWSWQRQRYAASKKMPFFESVCQNFGWNGTQLLLKFSNQATVTETWFHKDRDPWRIWPRESYKHNRHRAISPKKLFRKGLNRVNRNLKAQQRYSSYRTILVAIVSQNSFVLVFMGIAQLSGTKKKGAFGRGFYEIYASLGCSALSTKCTAESNILGYFLSLGRGAGFCRNPLC